MIPASRRASSRTRSRRSSWAVMWTVRPKVVASWQLTKATLTARTLEMSLVMLIMVSLCRSVWGLLRAEHRDDLRTVGAAVSAFVPENPGRYRGAPAVAERPVWWLSCLRDSQGGRSSGESRLRVAHPAMGDLPDSQPWVRLVPIQCP